MKDLSELEREKSALLSSLFELLCRFREWEPSLFDNPDNTDLGQAIQKAKTTYESISQKDNQ